MPKNTSKLQYHGYISCHHNIMNWYTYGFSPIVFFSMHKISLFSAQRRSRAKLLSWWKVSQCCMWFLLSSITRYTSDVQGIALFMRLRSSYHLLSFPMASKNWIGNHIFCSAVTIGVLLHYTCFNLYAKQLCDRHLLIGEIICLSRQILSNSGFTTACCAPLEKLRNW